MSLQSQEPRETEQMLYALGLCQKIGNLRSPSTQSTEKEIAKVLILWGGEEECLKWQFLLVLQRDLLFLHLLAW